MPSGNGLGHQGQGAGRSIPGGGRPEPQNELDSDWLAKTVGTVVLALGSIFFRALARKLATRKKAAASGVGKQTENEKGTE